MLPLTLTEPPTVVRVPRLNGGQSGIVANIHLAADGGQHRGAERGEVGVAG